MLRENRFFLIGWGIILIVGGWILMSYSKGDFVLLLDNNWNTFLDHYFKYITFLGNGWFYVIVIVFWLFIKYYYAIVGAISFVAVAMVIAVIKHGFFPNALRPKAYFGAAQEFHFVDGIDVHSIFSFPSGHSASAFSVFFLLALFHRKHIHGWVFLLIAFCVPLSRMYLKQHFFMDVYFGMLIGILVTMFTFILVERAGVNNSSWANNSLMSYFTK